MTTAPHALAPGKERAVLLMLAAVQFTHILDFMIMTPLGVRLMDFFSIGPAAFSTLVAAYGFAAAITGFVAGSVIDRFDRKKVLLGLYAGFIVSTLGCALAPNFASLLVARLLAGACGGVASSIVTAMVGDVVPPQRRGRAMAIVTSAFPIASVLGLPLGLFLSGLYSWHAPFFLLAGLGTAIWILSSRVLPQMRSLHPPEHPWTQIKLILRHPIHQRGFLVGGSLIFAGGIIFIFLAPSMETNVGLTERQLPLIYVAGGICTVFSTPIIGRLTDKYDKLHVLGWLSLAAVAAVWIVTHLGNAGVGTAMAVTAFVMVTMSGRFSPAMAMLSNAVESRYRGGFMSINSAIQQAASGLANILAGALVSTAADGRLVGYPRAGYVSILCFALTFWLAARLRAIAPHSTRPGHTEPLAPAVPAVD